MAQDPTLVTVVLTVAFDVEAAKATVDRIQDTVCRINTRDNAEVVDTPDHVMVVVRTDNRNLLAMITELEAEGFLD